MDCSKNEPMYKCVVGTPGSISATLSFCLVLVFVLYAIYSTDADIIAKYIVMGAVATYLLFLIFLLFWNGATVLTITQTEVRLSRCGITVMKLSKDEINAVGVIHFYHRSTFLYIAVLTQESKANQEQIKAEAKNANRKGSRMICIERTGKRMQVFQEIFDKD